MHNDKHDIILRNQRIKKNVDGNSYFLIYKAGNWNQKLNQNWQNFTGHSPNLKCLGFVFILSTHADKHYHMLSQTLIFTTIEKHAIKDQEDFIRDVMRLRWR